MEYDPDHWMLDLENLNPRNHLRGGENTMKQIREFFSGKKTFIVCVLAIIGSLLLFFGFPESDMKGNVPALFVAIQTALTGIGLRIGIGN